jgi:B9 domain-containing protein 1
VDSGLSQIARKDSGSQDQSVTWNFPIDLTFKATNAFGWPRIAISVYGVDGMGRDVVRGYGSVLVPATPGQHVRYVHMYAPISSSLLQRFMAWVSGTHPEFFDSKFVAQGEGREVTRVTNTGVVKVTINVMTKGMESFGYSSGNGTQQGVGSAAGGMGSSGFGGTLGGTMMSGMGMNSGPSTPAFARME